MTISVPDSLLAILGLGPCYGNQLRLEFERRTGGMRALNAGQVYSTLDRLERDGLVTMAGTNAAGQATYATTTEGAARARAWLAESSGDDVAVKLALVASLPGVETTPFLAAQRQATLALLERYRSDAQADPARRLVLDALAAAAEAELDWLDAVDPHIVPPAPLQTEPPKRGRPSAARG